MKSNIAILSGKLAGKTSRLIGKRGTDIPGRVGRKIDGSILRKLSEQVENIVLVTGTNGKTTTSNLLFSILKEAGKRVMNNAEGANLITGVTAAFIKHADWKGSVPYDYAVIEVDEGNIPAVLAQIKTPKSVIINNFFRDQLDRHAEPDLLIQKVMEGIKPVQTKLILNGDEPFTFRFSKLEKENVFFGLHKDAYRFDKHEMSDSKYCPDCGKELTYDHIHYAQLGYFRCTCGFSRPNVTYEVEKIERKNQLQFTLGERTYSMGVSGIHNVYNALAALTAAKELGIDDTAIQKGLETFVSDDGRMQEISINGVKHVLNLVKNPAGLNITLEEVLADKEEKQIVFYLNDLNLDGTDISWIWDADYERIHRDDIKEVICSGIRAYDLAIRCKYARVDESKINIIEDKEKAIEYAISTGRTTYHLPNYTAKEPVKNILEKRKG